MESKSEQANGTENGGFLVFLLLVTIILALVVWPFVSALLWSMLAAIMFQPLYQRILARWPTHPSRAALGTLAIIVIAVVVPAILIGSAVLRQSIALYSSMSDGELDWPGLFGSFHNALPAQLQQMLDNSEYAEFSAVQQGVEQFAQESVGFIAQQAVAIGGSALAFVPVAGYRHVCRIFSPSRREVDRLERSQCYAIAARGGAAVERQVHAHHPGDDQGFRCRWAGSGRFGRCHILGSWCAVGDPVRRPDGHLLAAACTWSGHRLDSGRSLSVGRRELSGRQSQSSFPASL